MNAQDTTLLVAGPMLGYIEHREALIWLQVTEQVTDISIKYFPAGNPHWQKPFTMMASCAKRIIQKRSYWKTWI